MYQKIEDFSLHILAAILIANLLTAVAVWYEIYYVVNDSTTATIKAILIDAVAAAALGIYIVGTVDTYMVLSKLILEKYLNNRFNAGKVEGEAKGREEGRQVGREEGRQVGKKEGRQQANEEWHAWYNRMVEARELGEEFDEPPPSTPISNS